MKISENLSDKEIKQLQKTLYEYFETGYHFEEFLKEYLIKMGLDEVQVTQRSKDGGIDLKAIRKGVGDFSDIDIIHYYVQAKRYKISSKISVNKVRELKGTIPFGYKGMFITTSFFTNDAKSEAINDPSKPVVLINGEALIRSCIDNQIGFVYLPKFSAKEMDSFLKHDSDYVKYKAKNYIEKIITANDIRARIISCPSAIMSKLDGREEVDVIINDDKEFTFSINKGRNYFAKVTECFREYGLLSDDNVITPRKSKWYFDDKMDKVFIYIGKENV
ncbi:type IV methyl-directed restriction enzyme Mrr [Campylobacter blaseri]|uniref:Restriction endonuclease n=1 Tax=Campylobacter blaseri TaxID=2042961 RepID=A0A2P8R0E0_9BACT|nr:restriction endonuclease [Campylobacter blaseri]PSM51961.1 restriction endonuclease [Campylobacter blaseri]PSM53746.1 restriction endonuclease [Campylobacter blaseri]QKF85700.1 type IV methyl-directed restriction enzyme Mrr [Campylobacter blaseri]